MGMEIIVGVVGVAVGVVGLISALRMHREVRSLKTLVSEIFTSESLKKGRLGVEEATAIAESTGAKVYLRSELIAPAARLTGYLSVRTKDDDEEPPIIPPSEHPLPSPNTDTPRLSGFLNKLLPLRCLQNDLVNQF